jgi:non-ribosomal peptide synthase protein (TIGR01720 family)
LAYFDLGAGRSGRLLVVIHHLAVDGVSWRILLEDLNTAYEQLQQGETVQLPPKTTSFRQWALGLTKYAESEEAREELDHWLTLSEMKVPPLPVDSSDGLNTEESARSVIVSLDQERTRSLLQEVPSVYRTEIGDVLLTALAQAVGGWTGEPTLLVAMEGHGRESILEDVDVSRTVGWFTSLYPVCVSTEAAPGPGEALTRVKEQLRGVPRRGIGYGILHYLCKEEDVTRRLKAVPEPELSFNYLGRMDQVLPDSAPFRSARESRGPDRSPADTRSYLLEIDGGIIGGQLRLEWTYSGNLHRRRTIERVAQEFIDALQGLINHCLSPDAGGYTASDFAEFGWDQGDLEDIVGEISRLVEQTG